MELLIVIIILAILVGIAVPVMLLSKKKASEATAKSNALTGSKCMEKVWFKIIDTTFPAGGNVAYQDSYRDFYPPPPIVPSPNIPNGYAVTGYYMSVIETKIDWAYMPVSGGQLYVQNIYRGRRRTRGTAADLTLATGQDWNKYLRGAIAVVPYRWTGAAWGNTNNRYITVMAVDLDTGLAHYTTYFQGRIYNYGTFTWLSDGRGHP